MKTKREILFDLQDEMFAKCKEVIRVKNSDYANGDDPYINFRSSDHLDDLHCQDRIASNNF